MRTKIIIRHDDVAALRSNPIWPLLVELMFAGGSNEVQEIAAIEDEVTAATEGT